MYIYKQGPVNLAAKPYSTAPEDLSDLTIHLTHHNIYKDNTDFNETGATFEYSKCDLDMLRAAYETQGEDYDEMHSKCKDAILKTLISGEHGISKMVDENPTLRNNCFCIYGFDFIVDDKLKPWLLKVNLNPTLASFQPTDKRMKTMLVCDALTIVGIRPYQKAKVHE